MQASDFFIKLPPVDSNMLVPIARYSELVPVVRRTSTSKSQAEMNVPHRLLYEGTNFSFVRNLQQVYGDLIEEYVSQFGRYGVAENFFIFIISGDLVPHVDSNRAAAINTLVSDDNCVTAFADPEIAGRTYAFQQRVGETYVIKSDAMHSVDGVTHRVLASISTTDPFDRVREYYMGSGK